MKSNYHSALALGACVIIGCGVIAMALNTLTGLISTFIAFAFGGWLLFQTARTPNDK